MTGDDRARLEGAGLVIHDSMISLIILCTAFASASASTAASAL